MSEKQRQVARPGECADAGAVDVTAALMVKRFPRALGMAANRPKHAVFGDLVSAELIPLDRVP
jgi:hypothetical protein